MDYSRYYDELREKLHGDFNGESSEIVLGLKGGDHRRVCAGVLAIYRRYQQMKSEMGRLQEETKQLQKELEHCSEALKAEQGKIAPPAQREDLDTAELYRQYKRLRSFKAVGRLYKCEGKTVKNRLRKAGYIE